MSELTYTSRHLAWGIAWLFGVPVLAFALVAVGAVPSGSQAVSAIVSALWGLGLVGIFGSWALQDAPLHGKSRYVALTFTVLWFVLLVLAVFPYLFATRGFRRGLLASLKFLSLLFALGIVWMAVFRLSGALFS